MTVLADADANQAQRRAIVVVPYGEVETWGEPVAERQAYEERGLSSVLQLRDPAVQMTYVTSSPVAAPIVSYYLSLLPRGMAASARARLTLVALHDRRGRSLSAKVLQNPSALRRIRRAISNSHVAHLEPYQGGAPERALALALGIPMYAPDPQHSHLGTKSGSRALFTRAGIPMPRGFQGLRSSSGVTAAIARLRERTPGLTQVIVKLDQGAGGKGNAFVDLAGLPRPGALDEVEHIEHRVQAVVPVDAGVTSATYLAKLARIGGVVEERIAGRELRSPSAQLEITPAGRVALLATHDQILGGPGEQQYLGCRFPADPAYAPAIGAMALRVGEVLAGWGVIGRFSVDFVVARTAANRWKPFAVEVNLRRGGTTHPYESLRGMVGGSYHADRATFTTPTGAEKHYVATDHLALGQLQAFGRDRLLALAQSRLGFDQLRRVGTIFHMLSTVEQLGRVGVTAIGDSAEEAEMLLRDVTATMSEIPVSKLPRAAHRVGPHQSRHRFPPRLRALD